MESWSEYWTGVSQNWVAGIIAVAASAAFRSWKSKKWISRNKDEIQKEKIGLSTLALIGLLLDLSLLAFSIFMVYLLISKPEPPSRSDVAAISFFSALCVKFINDTFGSIRVIYFVKTKQYSRIYP